MTRVTKARMIIFTAVALVSAGCAAGPNNVAYVGAPKLAGFWQGLWHGLIAPITFLISLFNHQVNIYEVHNDGNWYNFGFMLGIWFVFTTLTQPGRRAATRYRTR